MDVEKFVKKLQEKYPYALNEIEGGEVIIIVGENYQWVKADKIIIYRPETTMLHVHRFCGEVQSSPLFRNIPEKWQSLPVLFYTI